MTDNVKILPNTGAGSISVATDDVSDVHYPIYKTAYGADGEANLVTDLKPLPVSISRDETLELVLQELKIMNMHLSFLTDQIITDSDI